MVARRSKNKKVREREDLVRRSPVLSDGAKLLWIELQRGWAWNDATCDPSQESLAFALGWSIRRVKRRLAELVGFKMLKVSRNEKHQRNYYTLCKTVPEEICNPNRLINKDIVALKRAMMEERGTELSRASTEQGTKVSPSTGQNCPVAGDESVPWQGTEVSRKDELIEDELTEDELHPLQAQKRLRGNDSSSSEVERPPGAKSQDTQGGLQQGNDDSDEMDPLPMEDPISEKKERLCGICKKPGHNSRTCEAKAGRKRRANTLIPLGGNSLTTAARPAAGSDYVQAQPPPPEKPDDLLELIRSEVAEKYGEGKARLIPFELSGEQAGKLKNLILTKYAPDVVIAMTRVLVWDWEEVRQVWPPRPGEQIPNAEHLVIYRVALSGAATTGFGRSGADRGAHKTYAERYLNKGGSTPGADDPF